MPVSSVTNAVVSQRGLLAVLTAAALMTLSGCGSSDPVVSSDGTENGGGGQTDGSGTDGDSTGDGNGTTGGGNTGDDSDTVDGDELMPFPSARPVSKTYSCKSEAPGEDDVVLNLELTFDPATLEFLVDGDLVLTGGFTWNEASAEWLADKSTFLVDDANFEVFAKVALDRTPTYFRRKLTRADYSYVQTECYQGLNASG